MCETVKRRGKCLFRRCLIEMIRIGQVLERKTILKNVNQRGKRHVFFLRMSLVYDRMGVVLVVGCHLEKGKIVWG